MGKAARLKVTFIRDPFSPNARDVSSVPINPEIRCLDHYIPEKYRQKGFRYLLASAGLVDLRELGSVNVDPAGDELLIAPDVEGVETVLLIAAAVILAAGVAYAVYQSRQRPTFGGGDFSDSPAYGWDGVRTTADVDIPVPVVYGENTLGGNIINAYTVTENEKSVLYLLLALGEGPFSEIAGITADTDNADLETIGEKLLIENNPVTNYTNVSVAVRMGSNNQTVIPGFHQLHNLRSFSNVLSQGVPVTLRTDGQNVSRVTMTWRLDGLYRVKDNGSIERATMRLGLEFKKVGDASWTVLPDHLISKERMSSFRESYTFNFPTPGEYDVRVTKKSVDANEKFTSHITIVSLDEVTDEELSYPNTALLALKMQASDQLSGSVSNVAVKCKGLPVEQWNGSAWVKAFSRNPIWCIRDAILNKRYGLGKLYELAPPDDEALKVEAAYCDELVDDGEGGQEPRYRLDLVVDSDAPAYDVLAEMAATCNALTFWSSKSVMPLVDRPMPAVQLFTDGNIKKDSLRVKYKAVRQQRNRVEVQFYNEDLGAKRDIVQAVDADSIAAGEPDRIIRKTLRGVKSQRQAADIASALVKREKRVIRIVEFETAGEGVFCQPGDVIDLQLGTLNWGALGGRVESATAASFKPARSIESLQAGVDYWLTLRQNSTGALYHIRVKKPGALSTELFTSSGQTWAFHSIPTPAPFDIFALTLDTGQLPTEEAVNKQFRVLGIGRRSEGYVRIQAEEYDERVYDHTDRDINKPFVPTFPDPLRVPRHVTSIVAYNSASMVDRQLIVQWSHSPDWEGQNGAGFVSHYEVHHSTENIYGQTPFRLLGLSNTDQFFYDNASPLAKHRFKVLPVSVVGRKPSLDSALLAEAFVQTIGKPPTVRGLELFDQGNGTTFPGRDAKFVWQHVDTDADPIGDQSDLGAGAGTVGNWFQDYWVEIHSGGALRRTRTVPGTEFIYSGEMNAEDHNGAAVRDFEIRVWARDRWNQLSEQPAKLAVSNPKPAAPTGLTATGGARSVTLRWAPIFDNDQVGYIVLRGDTPGFLVETGTEVYRGPANTVLLTGLAYEAKHYRVAAFDLFGSSNLNWSASVEGTPAPIDSDDILANAINALHIAAGTITDTELADLAVTASKLADGAVVARAIAAQAVVAGKIAAGAVAADEIQAHTITADKYAEIRNTIVFNLIEALGPGGTFIFPFRVVEETTAIVEVRVSFAILPYRVLQSANTDSGGGETVNTTAAGGETVNTTSAGGETVNTTAAGGETGIFTSEESPSDPHNHTVSTSDHQHGVTTSDHQHGVTTSNHQHGVTTSNHSHGLTPGIVDYINTPSVDFAVANDGFVPSYGPTHGPYTTDQADVDITAELSGTGWKHLKFTATQNCRIFCEIELKLDLTA